MRGGESRGGGGRSRPRLVESVYGRCTGRTVLSVACSWPFVAKDRTSVRGGQRIEGMWSKRSSGGGEDEPRERNRRVVEQRGSARCSHAQPVKM